MISIIIPVYNVENYLRQCLQSVIDQSFTDWECILVNDGSTDISGDICDEFAKRDLRFVVAHQENQGVSSARNKGLEIANGEYICFIDSDDWVSTTYLSDMLSGLIDESVDMVVTGLSKINAKQESLTFQPTQQGIIKASKTFTKPFVDNVGLLYGPTAILYKNSIIRNKCLAFQQDSSFGEDTFFNFQYLFYVDSIYLVPRVNYFYREGEYTLSSKIYDLPFKRYEIWKDKQRFYISKNMWNEFSQEYMYKELWAILYDGIFSSKNHNYSYLKQLLSINEIDSLRNWQLIFDSPNWIKKSILHRAAIVFYSYLNFFK